MSSCHKQDLPLCEPHRKLGRCTSDIQVWSQSLLHPSVVCQCLKGTQEKLASNVCNHAAYDLREGLKHLLNIVHCMMMMTAVWDWVTTLWALGATSVDIHPWLVMPQVAVPKTASETLGKLFWICCVSSSIITCKSLSKCSSTSTPSLSVSWMIFCLSCSIYLLFSTSSALRRDMRIFHSGVVKYRWLILLEIWVHFSMEDCLQDRLWIAWRTSLYSLQAVHFTPFTNHSHGEWRMVAGNTSPWSEILQKSSLYATTLSMLALNFPLRVSHMQLHEACIWLASTDIERIKL